MMLTRIPLGAYFTVVAVLTLQINGKIINDVGKIKRRRRWYDIYKTPIMMILEMNMMQDLDDKM